jgi:hypothetical protein
MIADINGSGWSRRRIFAAALLERPVVFFGGDINSEHFVYSHRSENNRRLRLSDPFALVQGVLLDLRIFIEGCSLSTVGA